MLTAKDEEILKAVEASEAQKGSNSEWHEAKHEWTEAGGPDDIAIELTTLVKDDPTRAMKIITLLASKGKQELAAYSMHGLADADVADDVVFDFVRALAPAVAGSERMRSELSYILYRRAHAPIGLPDDLCKLIRDWLSQSWDSNHHAFEPEKADKPERLASVIWAPSGHHRHRQVIFLATRNYASLSEQNPGGHKAVAGYDRGTVRS